MADIVVQPLELRDRWSLRCREEHAGQLGAFIDITLPRKPLTSCAADGAEAWWLGPDEWLLLAHTEAAARRLARLDSAESPAGIPFSAVEITDRQLAIEVSGVRAAQVLNTGCPLDLDARVFPPGACTRTLFGKSEILLRRHVGADGFHLECWRSFLPYVRSRLQLAAADLPWA